METSRRGLAGPPAPSPVSQVQSHAPDPVPLLSQPTAGNPALVLPTKRGRVTRALVPVCIVLFKKYFGINVIYFEIVLHNISHDTVI